MPQHEFIHEIASAWPPNRWRGCHVLVAVSGGADSVALLRALAEIRQRCPGQGKLLAAHFNHRLRGAESDADEVWVSQLCHELDIPIEAGRACAKLSLTSEEQAREARYAFLLRAAESAGARYVAVAHTADDQVETVLMRVLRGSGIDGLAGIPFSRPLSADVTLVRPLLDIRRGLVESYLASLKQEFRTDETNLDAKFTRNWVRGTLLPLIRKHVPGNPDQAVLRLARQAGEWQEAFAEVTAPLMKQCATIASGSPSPQIVLHKQSLSGVSSMLVQQVCRRAWREAGWPEQGMGMAEWRSLAAAACTSGQQPFTLPGGVDVRSAGSSLVLTHP